MKETEAQLEKKEENLIIQEDSQKNQETKEINTYENIFTDIKNINNFLSKECVPFNDKFELLEVIKSGSAGTVFRGRLRNNPKFIKEIAFKFLNEYNRGKKIDQQNKKEKLQHMEISVHGILKNRHIPAIYGYHKIQNYSCISMEYVKYGDLENFKRKILKRSTLSETLLSYIGGGILEALYFLHIKNKIIHLDIKQQNVLIDEFLTIKLTDFSVSINYRKIKDYIYLPMVGTCYYMSPEILDKKKIKIKEASKIDIYSFGVLLYLLAFYDYPYKLKDVDSKNYIQILKNIELNDLEFPKDTGHSKVFIDFLKYCLNKNLKERFNIIQAMNHPWFKGYQIILNEKEKLYNAGKFIIDLMVDNMMPFNNYIKEQEKLFL